MITPKDTKEIAAAFKEYDAHGGEKPPLASACGSALHGATYKELDDANAALSAENAALRTAIEAALKFAVVANATNVGIMTIAANCGEIEKILSRALNAPNEGVQPRRPTPLADTTG